MITYKSDRELDLMRQAGRIVAEAMDLISGAIRPGLATIELDHLVEKHIRKKGGIPAFKGYSGFPASICASINEEVVHGIPGLRRLKEGDIISIDVGVRYKGYFGDAAATFPVGEISPEAKKLIEATRGSLEAAIEKVREGNHLSDISHAVQTYAESRGYSVVRNYVGHGIGSQLHEEPQIPNFGPPGRGPKLTSGMVLAIEPMVNMGTWQVDTLQDNWTVVTKDGSLSAHFEHTVAIVAGSPEVFTVS
jgi:methionyl aminopeptidase